MREFSAKIRMPFLFDQSRPLVVCPVDDNLIFGPFDGLENLPDAIEKIAQGHPDALLTYPGVIERHSRLLQGIPTFANLSVSTNLAMHTRKVLAFTVEHALSAGASGVAVHINLRSRFAPEMIENAGKVISQAKIFGIPTLGIVYPRGEHEDGTDDNCDELRNSDPSAFDRLVLHCVAFAQNMGFDAVKTFFPSKNFPQRGLVSAAGNMPVLLAGGPRRTRSEVLNLAASATQFGAAGVCFGRNVFGDQSPGELIELIREQMDAASGKL